MIININYEHKNPQNINNIMPKNTAILCVFTTVV